MFQSTHKMANLTQNEIYAVRCSKRQYTQHDRKKMATWNFAPSQFIKLWKSNTNINWNFHLTYIAGEGEGNQLPEKYKKIEQGRGRNGEEEGWWKNFCVKEIKNATINKYDIT